MAQDTLTQQEKDLRDQYAVTAFMNQVRADSMLSFYHQAQSYGVIKGALQKRLLKLESKMQRKEIGNKDAELPTLFDQIYKERSDGTADPEAALALFRAFEKRIIQVDTTASPEVAEIAAAIALKVLLDSHAKFACSAAKEPYAIKLLGETLRDTDKEATRVYNVQMGLSLYSTNLNVPKSEVEAFKALMKHAAQLVQEGKLAPLSPATRPDAVQTPKVSGAPPAPV